MPEKTLKEKVERARRFMAGFPDHEVELVQEALTALEARVEELEKERQVRSEADKFLKTIREGMRDLSPEEEEAYEEALKERYEELTRGELLFQRFLWHYKTSELVKEIEEAIELGEELMLSKNNNATLSSILSTLRRAREALRWIPVSERLPEDDGDYFVTADAPRGRVVFLNGFRKDEGPPWIVYGSRVLAWRERPAPYAPEEK